MGVDTRQTLLEKSTRYLLGYRAGRIVTRIMVAPIAAASVLIAPPAAADSAASLSAAVMSVRSGSCEPLRSDPIAKQAAEVVNQSTDDWLNFTGRAAPVEDPLPVMKDLGYGGNKGIVLQGAGRSDADAIKGLLIQGYLDIPDCSYAVYGASVVRNRITNYYLAALVLAA